MNTRFPDHSEEIVKRKIPFPNGEVSVHIRSIVMKVKLSQMRTQRLHPCTQVPVGEGIEMTCIEAKKEIRPFEGIKQAAEMIGGPLIDILKSDHGLHIFSQRQEFPPRVQAVFKPLLLR